MAVKNVEAEATNKKTNKQTTKEKELVTLATYNLAMKKVLQELLSVFGLLVGPHVSVVVAASIAVCYGQTGQTSE